MLKKEHKKDLKFNFNVYLLTTFTNSNLQIVHWRIKLCFRLVQSTRVWPQLTLRHYSFYDPHPVFPCRGENQLYLHTINSRIDTLKDLFVSSHLTYSQWAIKQSCSSVPVSTFVKKKKFVIRDFFFAIIKVNLLHVQWQTIIFWSFPFAPDSRPFLAPKVDKWFTFSIRPMTYRLRLPLGIRFSHSGNYQRSVSYVAHNLLLYGNWRGLITFPIAVW